MEVYQIKQLILGANETNCWIVVYGPSGDGSRLCALIDPGAEPDTIIAQFNALALKPGHILLTHGHFDHILALPDIHSAYPEAPIAIHRDDLPYLGPKAPRLYGQSLGLEDSSRLPRPGEGIRELEDGDYAGPFKVLSTPGHTPGSVVFLLEEQRIMFSGDTLFQGNCGRVDLPGGDQGAIERSLKRLLALDGDIRVLPGHGESTTIAAERGTRFF
ncbi:MAG: MBL fold metallo-hydrolase [Treponema sp.]|nr:MBL fold metallo-hydrolase [Treponema sp.]